MRRIVLTLTMLAALGAAGCNKNTNQPQAKGPIDSVSGTVALRTPSDLSQQAKLDIKLVDVSEQRTSPLASKEVAPVGQLPLQFTLKFDPKEINPSSLYVIKAEIVDGERHYTMPLQAPVLTKGAPATVSITLVAEQTPAEKMFAAFNKEKAQIGGMKITSGKSLGDTESRGWQVFSKDRQVQFIRELVSYDKGGFTSTDYAYKDGKPWVVVEQKMADQNAKPSAINRAGWSDDGSLVLKEHVAGGKTEALSEGDAKALRKQAEEIFAKAAKKSK